MRNNLAARDWNIILSESPSQEWHALFTIVPLKALSDQVFDLVFVFKKTVFFTIFGFSAEMTFVYLPSENNGELSEKRKYYRSNSGLKDTNVTWASLKNISNIYF